MNTAQLYGVEGSMNSTSVEVAIGVREISDDVALRRLYETAKSVHALDLSFEKFRRGVIERVEDGSAQKASSGLRAKSEDLFLVMACDEGIDDAWSCFNERYFSVLRSIASHWTQDRNVAEDVAQDLLVHLQEVPPGNHRTRLGTFKGRASLLSWLTVIMRRRFATSMRPEAQGQDNDDSRSRAENASGNSNPSGRLEAAEVVIELRTALALAWKRLTPKEAIVLFGRYRDGLSQRSLAQLLKVGEPRVSRIMQQALEKVRDVVLRELGSDSVTEGLASVWEGACAAAAEALCGTKESKGSRR